VIVSLPAFMQARELIAANLVEPVSGFEPLTVRLQEVLSRSRSMPPAWIVSQLYLRILLPMLTILHRRPCRLMPENAVSSVGFLWGPPPGSLTCGESVGMSVIM
jgi:hypothetical protein